MEEEEEAAEDNPSTFGLFLLSVLRTEMHLDRISHFSLLAWFMVELQSRDNQKQFYKNSFLSSLTFVSTMDAGVPNQL